MIDHSNLYLNLADTPNMPGWRSSGWGAKILHGDLSLWSSAITRHPTTQFYPTMKLNSISSSPTCPAFSFRGRLALKRHETRKLASRKSTFSASAQQKVTGSSIQRGVERFFQVQLQKWKKDSPLIPYLGFRRCISAMYFIPYYFSVNAPQSKNHCQVSYSIYTSQLASVHI